MGFGGIEGDKCGGFKSVVDLDLVMIFDVEGDVDLKGIIIMDLVKFWW